MLPDATVPVPASLMTLLAVFAPLFTAPSFRTFCGLACGFLAQPGKRTVCGMLEGAALSRLWSHDRAHSFFARGRWKAGELGIAAARLAVSLLVPAGEPVTVAIDDTLFRRRGKKVWAASWFHDGSALGPVKTGYGNNWVVLAVIVRLPMVARLAATTAFTQVTVTRYGRQATVQAAAVTCLWHSVFGSRPVTVVLVRDKSAAGFDLALVTTDTAATAAQVIERHASRRAIEVAIEDSKQVFGAGQARNRAARTVEHTIPFQIACQAITTCWYATAGHDPADIEDHRARAPWYTTKDQPSTADMTAKLRRVIIAARFKASRPAQPTPEEINVLRIAWEDAAA